MQTTYLKKARPVLEADVKALRQGVEGIIDAVRKARPFSTLIA